MAGQTGSPHPKHSAAELGKYKVIKDIAEGTFGKVKMAQHIITGQVVAMKFLSKEAISSSGTKTRVLREVQYMRTLKHPHIVKLYEVISTPTHIIIVLEYVRGELFNYIVKHGQMPEPRALRFFQQIISGIDYSHRLKIVHRDLKPENVLLDEQLNVKIADFGLSNALKDGEFLVTSCGSPNYAAPEVINGLRYTGPEIDVWSCGVILYVMLCGRLPFEDDDVKILFAKIANGSYHEPIHVSEEARYLLSRMLTVDPIKRITIPDILDSTFFKKDLPRYLMPLPPTPSLPVIGTLSNLVQRPKALGFEFINGLGRIEEELVQEIADSIEGVTTEDVLKALRIDEGLKGNAVKVAYMLLRDKQRSGKNLISYENEERDARLAALASAVKDTLPSLPFSPVEPKGYPYQSCFYEDDESSNEEEVNGNCSPPVPHVPKFAILQSSLPDTPGENSSRNNHFSSSSRSKHRKAQWHFGIRSRSPKTEIMLEIYKTLKILGMEWKEKRSLGGLGGVRTESETERLKMQRQPNLDGETLSPPEFDPRIAASIYFIEARARCEDIVVLMDLQLYQIDEENFLVDFKHQGYYKASTEPGASKFDRAHSPPQSETSSLSSLTNLVNKRKIQEKEDATVSPFLFMDTACRLILLLAGEGDSTNVTGPSSSS